MSSNSLYMVSGGRFRYLAYIPFLFFLTCFLFWTIGYPGHLVYKESSSLFLFTSEYFYNTVSSPGGLGMYVANFLTQFFLWPWAGALLIVLLTITLWLLTRAIIRRLKITDALPLFVWLPTVVSGFILLTIPAVVADLLQFVILFAFYWGYLSVSSRSRRLGSALTGFVLAVLFLPEAALIALYTTIILSEILFFGKIRFREWAFFILYTLMLILCPIVWRRYISILDDSVLYIAYPDQWFFVLLPVTLLGLWFSRCFHWRSSLAGWLVSLAILIGVGVKLGADRYNAFEEALLQMDDAIDRGEWERVMTIADRQQIFSRQMIYYIAVALANRGELGERLFDYPMVGVNPFYMPRGHSYLSSSSAGQIFTCMKVHNAGLVYTFDASMNNRYDSSFRTLKNLIRMNSAKGNRILAVKYLDLLDRSLLYGDWVKQQRVLLEQQKKSEYEDEFFLGYGTLHDYMETVLIRNPDDLFIRDYVLSTCLLEKDLTRFCRLFVQTFPYRTQPIPKYYQEALLVALDMQNPTLKGIDFKFSDDVKVRYAQFNGMVNMARGNLEQAMGRLRSQLGNSWWFYYLFVNIDQISVDGWN